MHQVLTKYILYTKILHYLRNTYSTMHEGIFKRESLFLNFLHVAVNNRVSNPCTVTFRKKFHRTGKQKYTQNCINRNCSLKRSN
jgi:hypothetical protein